MMSARRAQSCILFLALVCGAIPSTLSFSVSALRVSTPQWANLDEEPASNATSHLIFDTVNNLLQHWPNTRYRQGHNIVPGTIPVGTLLFHGRPDPFLPDVPEWAATDPEHSYAFCGTPGVPRRPENGTENAMEGDGGCWHLTIVTSRPLKVLYFDGSSAANMQDGTLDTQDMLAWGEASPERWLDERERLADLCAWGRDFGVDGFVRMEMDFEVMLCDFHSGIELVSADYLASWFSWPQKLHAGLDLHAQRRALPHSPQAVFSKPIPVASSGLPRALAAAALTSAILQAGSWHNHFPGELRIVLDYTKLISFYDTSLVPSYQLAAERWDHRASAVSKADIKRAVARLESALRDTSRGSGVDWRALLRGVVDRWAERIETLRYMLEDSHPRIDAGLVQRHLRILLNPYIRHSVQPTLDEHEHWASSVWQICATRTTAYIHASPSLLEAMTASENTLLNAFDDTNREICRRVVRMWSWGVEAGIDELLSPALPSTSSPTFTSNLHQRWLAETRALMSYLDWSVWVRCTPSCGPQQRCYLPTWPYFWGRLNHTPDEETRRKAPWRTPMPRCIRMWEPYDDLSERMPEIGAGWEM